MTWGKIRTVIRYSIHRVSKWMNTFSFFSTDKPTSEVITNPDSVTPIRGESLTLVCSVEANPKETSVLWFKNNAIINIDDRHQISSGQLQLTITQLDVGDNGDYSCKATNAIGEGSILSSYDLTVLCEYCFKIQTFSKSEV